MSHSSLKLINPEATAAYAFANQHYFSSVQQLRFEQMRLEAQKALLDSQLEAELTQREHAHNERQREVAEQQKVQMGQELARKQQLQAEKKLPGISPSFCGYPSIPQTPEGLRRSRKHEQQQLLKAELEAQVQYKKQTVEAARASDLQFASRLISDVEARDHSREADEKVRKAQQREALWKAWREAERMKKEQQLILSGRSYTSLEQPLEPVHDRLPKEATLTVSPAMGTSLSPNNSSNKLSPDLKKHSQTWRKSIALRLKLEQDQKARQSLEVQLSSQRKRLLQGTGKQLVSSQPVLKSRYKT